MAAADLVGFHIYGVSNDMFSFEAKSEENPWRSLALSFVADE